MKVVTKVTHWRLYIIMCSAVCENGFDHLFPLLELSFPQLSEAFPIVHFPNCGIKIWLRYLEANLQKFSNKGRHKNIIETRPCSHYLFSCFVCTCVFFFFGKGRKWCFASLYSSRSLWTKLRPRNFKIFVILTFSISFCFYLFDVTSLVIFFFTMDCYFSALWHFEFLIELQTEEN